MIEEEIDKITITYKNGDTVWVNDINLIEEYAKLQHEKHQLIERYLLLENKCIQQKRVIDEVRECLTGYSSIHTIQFGTEEDSPSDIELNKTLDEKTITEMTHRYLKVHDKLLQILDKEKGK